MCEKRHFPISVYSSFIYKKLTYRTNLCLLIRKGIKKIHYIIHIHTQKMNGFKDLFPYYACVCVHMCMCV